MRLRGIFCAGAFVFYHLAVLRRHVIGSRRSCPRVAVVLFFADTETDLRTGHHAEEEAFVLASPAHAGKDGDLDIVHIARVGVSAVFRLDILFPSEVGVVDLGLNGAVGGEILFARIADGETEDLAAFLIQLDFGVEVGAAQDVTCRDTNGQIIPMGSHLCLNACDAGEETQGEEYDSGWFH